ncbi:putative albumin I chain a [Medicago truncatula]|uniref:Albumin I n=1 Tax=Medicago truncatula TaxID=3880 RepID=A0A072V901_MEDTR|nr:albumin I [Medicago truncatula]RHN68203.1 putative albumin I chain a [Medicago truncatula]
MKKIEGNSLSFCSPTVETGCDYGCYCFICTSWGLGNCEPLSTIKKKVEEQPNLCWSHDECTKKGSGNYCARFPNSDIKYGWCFASISEEEDA